MSNDIRTGYELAAKAIAERGQAWSSRGDYALAMECSQLVSMLHDLKPVVAPSVASGAKDERAAYESWLGRTPEKDQFGHYAHPEASGKWYAWQARAAIAAQAKPVEMTDAQIAAMWKDSCINGGDTTQALVLHFAHRILANSAPNKALIDFVKLVATPYSEPLNSVVVYRDKEPRNDKMSELRGMARSALNAAGVEGV